MEEYARSGSMQATALGNRVEPELGKLKAASERIAKVRLNIDSFLERFNGGGPQEGAKEAPDNTSGYRNDIADLFGQIERLELVAAQLNSIG